MRHKKPVSEFEGHVNIKTINNLDNLIALCLNHHWEFDNGILNLDAGVGFEPTTSSLEQ